MAALVVKFAIGKADLHQKFKDDFNELTQKLIDQEEPFETIKLRQQILERRRPYAFKHLDIKHHNKIVRELGLDDSYLETTWMTRVKQHFQICLDDVSISFPVFLFRDIFRHLFRKKIHKEWGAGYRGRRCVWFTGYGLQTLRVKTVWRERKPLSPFLYAWRL